MSPTTITGEELPVATDDDLDDLLDASERSPILVYFTVSWCKPCQWFGPLLDSYHAAHPDLDMRKADCRNSPDLASHFAVEVYPTLVLLRHGQVHWTYGGALTWDELVTVLDPILAVAPTLSSSAETACGENFHYPLEIYFPSASCNPAICNKILRGDDDFSMPDETIEKSGFATLASGDSVMIVAHGDERLDRPLDLSILAELEPAPYDPVVLHARTLSANELEYLVGMKRIGLLMLSSLEPLSPDAIDTLIRVRMRSLQCKTPGFDAEQMRRAKPGTSINYSSLSMSLASALSQPPIKTRAAPVFTSAEEIESLIQSGRPVLAMFQAEHPADLAVASVWHTALGTGALQDACTVSAYGTRFVHTLNLDLGRPAVALFNDGELRWLHTLPRSVDALKTLSVQGVLQHISPATGALTLAPTTADLRSLRLPDGDDSPLHIELVQPGSTAPAAIVNLTTSAAESVPLGWRVRARAYINEPADLRWEAWSAVGVQELSLDGSVNDAMLAGLGALTDLEDLVIGPSAFSLSALVKRLRPLPALKTLRVHGTDADDQLHSALPRVIINGVWPRCGWPSNSEMIVD